MPEPPDQPVPRPHPLPHPQPGEPVAPAPSPGDLPDAELALYGNSSVWLSQGQRITNFLTKNFPGGLPTAVTVPAGLGPPGVGFVADAQTSTPAGSLLLELGLWLGGPPSSGVQALMQAGLRQSPIVIQPPAQPHSTSFPNNPDGSMSLFLTGNMISTLLGTVFSSVAGTSLDLTNILGYEVEATLLGAGVSCSTTAPVITTTITGSINTIPSVSFTATITDTFSVVPGQGLVSTPTVSVDAPVTTDVILALLSAALFPGWLAAAGALFFGLQAGAVSVAGGQAGPALAANSPGTLLAAFMNRATIAIVGGAMITSTITNVDPFTAPDGIIVIGDFFLSQRIPEPAITLQGASELQWYADDSAAFGAPVTYTAITSQIQQPIVTWSLDSHAQAQSPKPAFQFGLCDEQTPQGIVFPSPGTTIGREATHTLTATVVDGTASTVQRTASMSVSVVVVEPPKPPPPPPPPIEHPPER